MTRPLAELRYLECDACHYHYAKGAMERRGPSSFVCRDKEACRARRAERDRLDAWKRGQR